MAAPKFNLKNLYAIVDNNKYQQTGTNKDIMPNDNLLNKFKNFGWSAKKVNGHSIKELYDYFEKKIIEIRKNGILHDNIILDPGIGFGKNLKHNITLISNISLFHSLGFPILLGISRKRFIKELSGVNDSKERLGGTISSSLYAMTQGVQIIRVHNVNEVNQSIKVFKSLIFQ